MSSWDDSKKFSQSGFHAAGFSRARRPRERDSWAGEAVEEMERDRAERLIVEGLRRLGKKEAGELASGQRDLLARWVHGRSRVGVKWLAGRLGLSSAGTMSYGIWLAGQRLEADRETRKYWKTLNA